MQISFMKRFFQIFFISIILFSCARVGSPIGGEKDTIAPTFLGANIDSPRTNVPRDIKELRLEFDEYVMLKDFQKNVNISPPIKKIKKVIPSNLATKFISIQWEDTLQANTTYNFNFGNAIQDNNESNPLSYFNFAFSTGEKIDDTYISGEIKDALIIKTSSEKKNKVVGLYKEADSIDYRQKPYYITKVDDDGYYELNYLSPGTYRIIAFEDENGNSVYDPGTEKIGFQKDSVVLDKSISGLNMNVFPVKKNVKYKEIKENPGGVLFLFEGNPEKVEVKSEFEKLKDYRVTHKKRSDSVFVWFNAKEQNIGTDGTEILKFSYDADGKRNNASLPYKYNEKNEMTLSNESGNILPPRKDFALVSNYLVERIQPEKWSLNIDSLTTEPFTARIDEANPFRILVSANFKEKQKYQLTVPKSTVYSYYESNAQSIRFDFEADEIQNYGSFTLRLANKPTSKFWVQLLNADEKVMYSKYTSDAETKFPIVKPESYAIRILVDNNENGFWDAADFSTNTFAEEAYIYHKIMNIRPLWDSVEDWDLSDKTTIGLKPGTTFAPAPKPKAQEKEENTNPNTINRNNPSTNGNLRNLELRR